MTAELVLTPEQVELLNGTTGFVTLRDDRGTIYGQFRVDLLTAETIAELKRQARSPGPWYTSAQVRGRLAALEAEWARTGGFDREHMQAFLEAERVADPGHFREPEPGA